MSEATENEHPTKQDRILAGVIAVAWVVMGTLGSVSSTSGTAGISEQMGALAGTLFVAAVIYVILVNVIKWYHS
ncbi:hypothetical protein [Halosimplex carlsbadense]|uniref:hypothetical protein n=1 Tax=Halosimplex carlsbadense TaxID=171164 RepID=UPI000677FD31|nr:hypothetical protein [Halosimplex carlsbadense]